LALAIGLLAARNLGAAQPLSAARTAQSKLERVLPPRLKTRLSAVNESITSQFGHQTADVNQGILMRMTGAAQDQRRVSLRYQTQQGVHTQRNFDPYGLVYQRSRWYAVGMCHVRRGPRSFRLDRIAAASIMDAQFERPASFDALDYLWQSIAELPRSHSIEVLLHTDLATAQRELFCAFGILEWTGDAVLLRSQAYDLNWFARELARLPIDFIVRSPAALREALTAHGRRLTRLARQRKPGK
jgi:predicted DNA-binding transcriptional regulator YafY